MALAKRAFPHITSFKDYASITPEWLEERDPAGEEVLLIINKPVPDHLLGDVLKEVVINAKHCNISLLVLVRMVSHESAWFSTVRAFRQPTLMCFYDAIVYDGALSPAFLKHFLPLGATALPPCRLDKKYRVHFWVVGEDKVTVLDFNAEAKQAAVLHARYRLKH